MARDKAGNSIKTANQDAFSSLKPKAINFSDSIGGTDTSDYFYTKLRRRSSVEFSLTGLKESANLELLQKNGSLVQRAKGRDKADKAINTTLEAGVYYIHVAGASGETGYSLRATGNFDKAGDSFTDATAATINGRTVFKDYVGPSDNNDFYQFTTGSGSPKQLKLQLKRLKSNANLTLFDSDQNIIFNSKQAGTASELITQVLDPDSTYFVRVAIANNKVAGTPYRLVSNLGAVADRAGNTQDNAAKLLTLPAIGGDDFSPLDTELLDINDVDVYRFVGPNDPTSVDLRLSGLSADADLYLYEEGNPTPIAISDQTGTSNETISGAILTPGATYYLKVQAFDSSQYTFFNLSARTKTGIEDNAGNTPETARDIDSDPVWKKGIPNVKQGPLDPANYLDGVGTFDSDDYYSFTLNDASFVRLKADLSTGNANLRLLSSNGTTPLEAVSGTASDNPRIEGVFAAGTYYIQVASNGGAAANAFYKLNLEAESVALKPAFVKDIRRGPQGSATSSGQMVEIGGILYFAADDGSGVELWRTDGTAVDGSATKNTPIDGTEKLTDGAFQSIANLTVASVGGTDVLFFAAETQETGSELWRWDAVNGASLVKDIAPGSTSSSIGTTAGMVAVGNRVYFDAIAQPGSNNIELWYSDGTEAGTQSLEIVPGEQEGSLPRELVSVGGKLYFAASNRFFDPKLFTIEISNGNVTAVEVPGQSGLNAQSNLTNVNGTLYFTATGSIGDGPDRGNEIWRLSSTGAIEAVTDIVPGTDGAFGINSLTVLGDSLFFAADGKNGAGLELWEMTINPTTKATSVLLAANINTEPGIGSNPSQLTVSNGKLFLIAGDETNGQGLWQYDPTAAPTDRLSLVQYNDGGSLKDVTRTGGVSLDASPGSLIAVGDFLYFKANRDATGSELWRVNPLLSGRTEELELRIGQESSAPRDFTEVNGRLFFRATDGETDESAGFELWVVGLPNT